MAGIDEHDFGGTKYYLKDDIQALLNRIREKVAVGSPGNVLDLDTIERMVWIPQRRWSDFTNEVSRLEGLPGGMHMHGRGLKNKIGLP